MITATQYIKRLKEPQKKIVQALRELIKKTLPDVKEQHYWNVLYYSPACYLTVHDNHVSLGFTHRKHYRLKKLTDIKKRIFAHDMREAMIRHESHR